jgi:type IV secretion system protein VirB10
MSFEKDKPDEGGIFDAFGKGEDPDDGVVSDIEIETSETVDGNDIIDNPFEGGDSEGSSTEVPSTPFADDGSPPEAYDTEPDGQEAPAPFTPSKTPVSRILDRGPHKLNKTFILYILFGVLAIFIIFTMVLSPLLVTEKEKKTKKPDTAAVTAIDYSTLVPRQRPESPAEVYVDDGDDEEIMSNLPPVDPAYQYQPPSAETPPPVMASGTGKSERPDTKGDGLQSKNIAGIKGITPTQRQYLDGGGSYQSYPQSATSDNPYAQYGMPGKDDYTAQMLSQYAQQSPAGYAPGNTYANQNDQSGKMNFYNAGRENAGNGVWLGPATIWQGTIFEAVLTSNINTDLPGEVTAILSKNIYSSLDGRYLLIPQNSRLYGSYNSSISYSQSRVQVGWHTLIRPDGYAINLGNMAATDAQGAAGVKGHINDHLFQYVKALALMSAFNIINSEFENTTQETDNQYVQNILANSQSIATTLGSKLIDRAVDVQPTITIKAGLKINIVANTNLALPPLPPYDVTMPYHR